MLSSFVRHSFALNRSKSYSTCPAWPARCSNGVPFGTHSGRHKTCASDMSGQPTSSRRVVLPLTLYPVALELFLT